ncbi:hypothetical protein [Corallococcus sp. M7]
MLKLASAASRRQGRLSSSKRASASPPIFADAIPRTSYIGLINPRRLAESMLRVTDHEAAKSIASYVANPEQLSSTVHGVGIQLVGYGCCAVLAVWRFPALTQLTA